MRRTALALATLLAAALTATPTRAQTAADSAGVRQAALDYLDGFYVGDSTLHVRSIRPEVYKYGFYRARDSVSYARGQQMTWTGFHDFTRRVKASGRAPQASWPKDVRLLDMLDQTAAAKVTAWWGTDYLLMGRFDGRWMITHVIWQSPPPRGSAASR